MGDRKSWRDIDRQRDTRSHGESGGGRGGSSPRVESATKAYKRKLDAFFDEGVVPEHLKEKLGASAEGPSERQLLLRAIRQAESGKPLTKAIDAFLAEHEMFDDMELLLRVLEHPKDPVLAQALDRIEAYLESGQAVPRKNLFRRRLEGLEFCSFDPRVQRKAQVLAGRLQG